MLSRILRKLSERLLLASRRRCQTRDAASLRRGRSRTTRRDSSSVSTGCYLSYRCGRFAKRPYAESESLSRSANIFDMTERHIVALGGGGFSMEPRNPRLDDFILRLTGKKRPRVCFIGTASGDSDNYIARFSRAFAPPRARP